MRLFIYQLFRDGELKGQRIYCERDTMIALKNGADLLPINRPPTDHDTPTCHACRSEGRIQPAASSPVNQFAAIFIDAPPPAEEAAAA
jgi:hypothetical protein